MGNESGVMMLGATGDCKFVVQIEHPGAGGNNAALERR
jgi:hypothetical protein